MMRVRRRLVQLRWLVVFIGAVRGEDVLEALFGSSRSTASTTPTMSVSNLTAAVAGWTGQDVAVFYYSPYGDAGKFSRQVLPLWDEVWRWHTQKRTKVVVAKFNCETSLAHQQLCFEVGVRQYPTLTFYGYSRLSWRRGILKRSTNYRGLALAEAIRDWTVAVAWLSRLQRLNDRFLFFLGLKAAPETVQLEALRAREKERTLDYERRLEEANRDLAAARRKTTTTAQQRDDTSTTGAGLSGAVWDDLLADLAARYDNLDDGDASYGSGDSTTTTTTTSGKQQQKTTTTTSKNQQRPSSDDASVGTGKKNGNAPAKKQRA